MPVVLLLSILGVTLGVLLLSTDDYSIAGPILTFLGVITVLILAPAYFGFILPPYDASYYQTYRITGTAEQIDSAFNNDGGTMSQVFVAKVEGVDKFIRSDDQRFRTIHVGDQVNLVCSKEFRYFQDAWYECSFGGS